MAKINVTKVPTKIGHNLRNKLPLNTKLAKIATISFLEVRLRLGWV